MFVLSYKSRLQTSSLMGVGTIIMFRCDYEADIDDLLGLYWNNGKGDGNYYSLLGLYWDNGKENGNYYSLLGLYWVMENGNYYSLLGLYWDNGKENGNYYSIFGFAYSALASGLSFSPATGLLSSEGVGAEMLSRRGPMFGV